MVEIKKKLAVPRVPNYILEEGVIGRREDGLKETPKHSIADLDDSLLERIADEWRANLLARAAEIRAMRKEDHPS